MIKRYKCVVVANGLFPTGQQALELLRQAEFVVACEDHTLGNISLLAQYVTEFERVEMVSDFGWFTPLYRTTTLDSEPGQQVSLFSLYPNGRISVSGLRYPIEKRRLLYWWEATLNEATGKEFTVILEEDARVLVYRTFSSL